MLCGFAFAAITAKAKKNATRRAWMGKKVKGYLNYCLMHMRIAQQKLTFLRIMLPQVVAAFLGET